MQPLDDSESWIRDLKDLKARNRPVRVKTEVSITPSLCVNTKYILFQPLEQAEPTFRDPSIVIELSDSSGDDLDSEEYEERELQKAYEREKVNPPKKLQQIIAKQKERVRIIAKYVEPLKFYQKTFLFL